MHNASDHPAMGGEPIAVVGLASRFPGADTAQSFWANLRAGVESVAFSAKPGGNGGYVGASAALDGAELFDAAFFGMSARDAELTDPQHRVFLESAWEALEDAGCDPRRYPGAIGVFAGASRNGYFAHNLATNPQIAELLDRYQLIIASENDFLATRAAFKLDLRGPALTIQTACSTSLVAVHLACRSLRDGECAVALAGGVSVRVPQADGYRYKEGGMLSPDGRTRPFDRGAHGTLFGAGVGVAVLKRLGSALADGDSIRAVILGTAVNNDGSEKDGFTAPSSAGQAAVIRQALERAGVEPDTVSFVEAHGTGTRVGDPVELAGLAAVFGGRKTPLAVGSAKGNIGHSDAASGMAGLFKTVMALQHRELPATLNCDNPIAEAPFEVNTALRRLEPTGGTRLRAGVTSLGFGGTNAHAVLEEPPQPGGGDPASREWQVLVLSARSEAALERATDNLAEFLKANPAVPLADVAWTLQTGRAEFGCRRALVCRSAEDAAQALETRDPRRVFTGRAPAGRRPVAFLFPGHGSHYVNMARGLYDAEPVFRQAVDRCAGMLEPHLGFDLREVLYPSPEEEDGARAKMRQTHCIQTSLFLTAYAFATLWKSWGVQPDAVIGYSIGELAAACVSGVLSLEDGARLAAVRSLLVHSLPPGGMLAALVSEDELRPLLGDELDIGAASAPRHTIASGPHRALDSLEQRLEARGIGYRRLDVPHAFHSAMMEPVLDPYRKTARSLRFRPPEAQFVSTVTGAPASASELTDPDYWVRELREPVRFSPGVETLARTPGRVFLEAGPSQLLSALTRGHPAVTPEHGVLSSCRNERHGAPDVEFILRTLGRLWLTGQPIDWAAFHGHERRLRVPLPTYPFERQRFWIDPPTTAPDSRRKLALREWTEEAPASAVPESKAIRPERPETEWRIEALWRELLGCGSVAPHENFLDLGGNSLVAVQLLSRVRDQFGRTIPLRVFLETPTIEALGAAVAAGEELPAADACDLGRLVEEIERMRPEEVRAELSRLADPAPEPPEPPAGERPMDFGLMLFSADADASGDAKYRLVTEAARFADRNGFSSVWMPERHFHRFGGLYPNPAVLGAAIAAMTERIRICAGSVITPLHDPLRIVEDWSVIDNLSGGRVGIAFASGFHPADFALAPDRFADRHATTAGRIAEVRRLWAGGTQSRTDGVGDRFEATPYPRPLQAELPTWITATRSTDTFRLAGELGTNVLTALLRMSAAELKEKIAIYRGALAEHGRDPASRKVTLMLHTYVGHDERSIRRIVEGPLLAYLRSHMDFLNSAGEPLGREEAEALLAHAFERYWSSSSLFGTPESCLGRIGEFRAAGVDEIACLVDFGVGFDDAMEGLKQLARLMELACRKMDPA